MAFSISGFVSDSNDDVVSVDWQYTTADGSLGNTHVLATPAGDFALAEVTQATLITWLESQLGNTTIEFDAALAARKTRSDYEAGFVSYSRESDNTYAVVPSDSV